jgi:hypothetical protein
MRDGDKRRRRAAMIGYAFAAGFAGAFGGCSADVLDVTVDLKPQTFALDFGQEMGTIPVATCDDTIVAEVCGGGQSVAVDTTTTTGVPSDVQVELGCDPGTARCFAQATAHASQPVNVLQDDAFVTRIERNALDFVHLVDVAYTVPANTLTFDIPRIDIYAGPSGARRETDPGVAFVGSTQSIAAGTVVTDPLHVTITDETPARPVIEAAIENKQEFVFIVVATPRLDAGAPIPAGAVQIDVSPSLVIGLPR